MCQTFNLYEQFNNPQCHNFLTQKEALRFSALFIIHVSRIAYITGALMIRLTLGNTLQVDRALTHLILHESLR